MMENGLHKVTIKEIADMTEEQKETMQKALFNPLILHKIVNGMDFPELKMCRRVNQSWKFVATEVIKKRDSSIIRICFNKYHQIDLKDRKIQRLDELNEILEKSTNFPCSDFQFRWGSLTSAEVQKCLEIHGHNIKTLRLVQFSLSISANPEYCTPKSVFCQVLRDLVPNIETLHLDNIDYDSWTTDDELLLPSLKIFEWSGQSGSTALTALKILEGAKNLKLIPALRPTQENLDALEKSGKTDPGLVVRLRGSCGRRPELLSRFGRLGPKLEELVLIPHVMSEAWKTVLENLLKSAADSLTCLTIKGTNSNVNLPKLKNLHTLALNGCGNYGRIFPTRINLLDSFPNLRVLDLTSITEDYSDESRNRLFPPVDAYQGNFPCVKTLKISHKCSNLWMMEFLDLCPNFKELVVISESHFDVTVLSTVFKLWSHLESLQLIIIVQDTSLNDFFMDREISGMSPSTCEFLRSVKSLGFVKGFEDYIIGPSIRNAKGLKTFIVRLVGNVTVLPFSCVAGIYSFNLMPDLKVVLQFDHSKLSESKLKSFYEELASHMNIRHVK